MLGPSMLRCGGAVRVGFLVLVSLSGCADIGTGTSGIDDPVDGDGITDVDAVAEPAAIKAGLDNPPIAVGPFLNGVFPPRTPNAPGSSTWDVVSAYPALNLGDTLVITPNPSNDRLYVGARDGLIHSFDTQNATSASTFLDLRDRVAVVWDGGFLGLIFHPEVTVPSSPYANYFYVFYSSHCPLNANRDAPDLNACDNGYPRGSTGGFFNTYLRLSRFEMIDDTTADPDSERVMINIRLYNGSHRSGGMVFRNDGYLHLTIGDQFHYETAQDIVDTLEGGSVRLEVGITDNGDGTWSCPAGSHLPRRMFDTADEISGQWYCIPDDNPWLDPGGGVFEEYCSIGHRNPHRLTWDPVTDFMWTGEVGESTREEINVISCGNNYGWPFREGLIAGVRSEPSSYLGTLTDPVIDFVRTEARAIIGGYVYRGSRYAELYGRYIAGDYVTGNIWAITLDETTMTATKEFLTVFDPGGLGTFGQDNDGEVYLGDVINGGTLYELERIGQSVPDPPALLSDTGAFSDTPNLVPSAAWVPYALNQPFWSDGASKWRYAAVPNDGLRDTANEQVAFSETSDWSYPIGTVLMKHFELPVDETDPSITDRLETRFLVHGDDGEWYGITYRHRSDGTDADLLVGADSSQHTVSLAGGGSRNQIWNYPSRLQCKSCHRSVGALGPRTHQLNGDFTYPSTGRTDNQLATWNHLGMFTPALVTPDIPTMIRSKALGDVTASLEDRARSWLDSNCSNCHRPGEVQAGFDMRYTTPFLGQGLVYGAVRDDLGMPGTAVIVPGDIQLSALYQRIEAVGAGSIAMPPLAKELAEQPALDLIGEWILRIDPNAPQQGVDYEYWESSQQLTVLPDFAGIGTPDKVGTTSTFDISVRDRDDDFVFRFRAFLQVDIGGQYTFYTSSDDGSKLYINGSEIVDNDGLHGNSEQSGGPIALAAGYHAIEVTMFERGGSQVLTASWSGPDTGNNKQLISATDLFVEIPVAVPNDPPTLQTPPQQASLLGESVVLDLLGNDDDGDLLYFDAADLPMGLSIDHETGTISGTVTPGQPIGTYDVTASVSDGPEVAVVNFDWVVGSPVCGNNTLEVGEECDDGNTSSGDGCSSICTIEVTQVCGDGIVTAPEECELPGTAVCTDVCTFRIPVCGDGLVTPPENCEDGNVVGGDGCSSSCMTETTTQDVTANGAIISFAVPAGTGNRDPEVIRDGDKPSIGTADPSRQYDTWNGAPRSVDWVGYTYGSDQIFSQLVFQEGMNFFDGGWFDSITVQVRQSGTWVEVTNLSITPAYTFGNGIHFETFTMDFDPVSGDGVRLYGDPGGSANFISVGELEVYALVSLTCGNGTLNQGEECDDGNLVSNDGCSTSCTIEFCGDGTVNNGTETCEPPGDADCNDTCTARTPLCGDGFVTSPETCEDGNTVDGDGCSSVCQDETSGEDLTDLGSIVARVMSPLGGGNHNPEVIRDGDFPPVNSTVDSRQFDTWDGGNTATEDWIGYVYPSQQVFGRGVFQEGKHFFDGGWFDSLTVQVRQGGLWSEVSNVTFTPSYSGNNGVNYETFEITFDSVTGDGIRIYGAPGGSADFISVGELEIYAPAGPQTCGNGVPDGVEECDDGNSVSGDGCSAQCVVEFCGDDIVNNVTETCDPPGTATCNDSCIARVPLCGDMFVTAPETCDDGNTINGDGCDSTCNTEAVAVCGDSIVTPPEDCDPPGTATCNDSCATRTPLCGDTFVTAPETCDDGNTIGGDGCSSTCDAESAGQDLTDTGSIIGSVLTPAGGGNRDPETIRDNDKPPVGSVDDSRQFDTWDGPNTAPTAWIGYSYTSPQVFGRAAFQEGKHFFDGGWFDSLTLQVRQNGVWNNVTGLSTVPSYPGNNGVNFETFEMTFVPMVGDGIRLYGAPGGSADFISVGEFEVFAPGVVTCGNGVLDGGEQCDDGNVSPNDGCGPSCFNEVCGDGIVNNGVETCEPPGTAQCELDCTARAPVCGDGFVTAPETCEDGNTDDGDGCSSLCLREDGDLTDIGTIIAAVPNPVGDGNRDPETIRDNDFPPIGNTDNLRQFDTWDGGNTASQDWIGYSFPTQYSFNRVVFQEGKHFFDGGWFDTLIVQVRQGTTWVNVTGFSSSPTYPGSNNGVNYETYELTFNPMTGNAIRIFGAPGGSADFISVGELEVYGSTP